MRLLKPEWVSHDGKPVFSIDIHPDGSRVATGGQGDDCGKVVVWNMAPIRDEKEEADVSTPKVLCQMDNHLGCVNCVRWSQNGKFLASGGDDKLVMIWQTSRVFGSGKSFGSSVTIVEQWRPVATLRGHTGDVLDLAWSPHDIWFASCSVDNTIVIWNAQKFPEQVAVLKGHSGLVKGITWDPVGKYLASQSDDKTLRVWRTSDWKEEVSIASCFKECAGTTHVLRLNWSPDGNHIVSAHAMNNAGPTAQIVERNGWGTSLDFVGHRKAITVVRFNPKIMSKQIKKMSEKQQQYSCCAIGSKDRSLSIWLTALKRPLVVLHDMFEKSILDISWSSTGLDLMCCSLDGTVAYLGFDEGEIGTPMTREDQQALLEKLYGKSILTGKTLNAASQIIESAAVLKLQQQQQQLQQRDREVANGLSTTPSKSNSSILANGDLPFKPRDKQIETRTADGRRRITPIFLAPQPDIGDADVPAPFTSKTIAFTSSKETSKIVVEKQDRVTQPGWNVSSNSSLSHSVASPPRPVSSAAAVVPSSAEVKTTVGDTGIGSDGLATLTPLQTHMEIDKTPHKPVYSSTPLSRQESHTDKEKDKNKEKEKDKEKDKDRDKERDKEKDRDRFKSGSLSLKKRHGKVGRPRKAEKEAREALMAAVMSQNLQVVPEREAARQMMVASHHVQLPVSKLDKTAVKLVDSQAGVDSSMALEVENMVAVGTAQLHRCRCVCAGKVQWEQFMTSRILDVAGSRQAACVACEDKTVTVFNMGGKRLLPPLVLGSQISVLECTGPYVMAITTQGYLHVCFGYLLGGLAPQIVGLDITQVKRASVVGAWNVLAGRGVVQGQSLSAIMSVSDKIVNSALTNEGVPLITISNGKSYSFAPEIGCWMLVNDRDDQLRIFSNHHRCIPPKVTVPGPLTAMQNTNRPSLQANRVFQSDASLQQVSTLSHLENQLATSLAVKSACDYRFWLETYVRYLVQEGLEEKLRAVCDELLGPVFSRTTNSKSLTPSWQPSVLGLDKRKFLKSMLPNIGANLRWQRLYTEYQEQLETLTSDP